MTRCVLLCTMSPGLQVTAINRCFVIFIHKYRCFMLGQRKFSKHIFAFIVWRWGRQPFNGRKLGIGAQCLLIGWFMSGRCGPLKWLNSKRCDMTWLQSAGPPLMEDADSSFSPCQLTVALSACQVEEADHIYLLMKEEYRISRNVRLAWFLGKLNQVIWPASKPELVSFRYEAINVQEDTITTNHAWDVEEPTE